MFQPMIRAIFILSILLFSACDAEHGRNEQRDIHARDMPALSGIVRSDIDRGLSGVTEAAERMRRGFLVEDQERREREMRAVMQRLQRPPRSVLDLMVIPISFLAAVDTDGVVIARDADNDLMRGFELVEVAPVVQRALAGSVGYELSELPSTREDGLPSVTIIFAAPARHEGRVVGAMVAGLPLYRMAQQMTRQLQLDNADDLRRGELIWVMLLRGDEAHYHSGMPWNLREVSPSVQLRREALIRSPGGYTGEFQQHGRWFGYGILPVPAIADDVQVMIFRSDPP